MKIKKRLRINASAGRRADAFCVVWLLAPRKLKFTPKAPFALIVFFFFENGEEPIIGVQPATSDRPPKTHVNASENAFPK
jgi:hypothetical protein